VLFMGNQLKKKKIKKVEEKKKSHSTTP